MKKEVIGTVMAIVIVIVTTATPGFSRSASAKDKYQCNSCGQKFSSKVSSHNHTVTCDGTMSKHKEVCDGNIKWDNGTCGVWVSGTTGSTKDSDGQYYTYITCSKGHSVKIESTEPNHYVDGYCPYKCYSACYKCDKCGRTGDSYSDFDNKYYCNKCSNYSYSPGRCSSSRTKSCYGSLSALKATLTFNSIANGGSSSNFTRNPCYDSDYSYTTSDTASKDGWEFIGWNTNRNAKAKQSSVKVDDDKSVYAIFKKDVKVSFIDG